MGKGVGAIYLTLHNFQINTPFFKICLETVVRKKRPQHTPLVQWSCKMMINPHPMASNP